MTSLLKMKENVSKIRDAISINLDLLSNQIQDQIDGLVGTSAMNGRLKNKKRKKRKYVKRNTLVSSRKPPRKSLKGIKQGKRAKNDVTLKQGIIQCLGVLGGAAPTRIIAERMLSDGWNTNSKKFTGVVGQALISSDAFKRNKEGNWYIA